MLFCDNKYAMHLAFNHFHDVRSKHIIDCHFIRVPVQMQLFTPIHVNTKHKITSIFTNAISATTFNNFIGVET